MAIWKQLATVDNVTELANDANTVILSTGNVTLQDSGTFHAKTSNTGFTVSPSADMGMCKWYYPGGKSGLTQGKVSKKGNTISYFRPAVNRDVLHGAIRCPFSAGSSWKISKVECIGTALSTSNSNTMDSFEDIQTFLDFGKYSLADSAEYHYQPQIVSEASAWRGATNRTNNNSNDVVLTMAKMDSNAAPSASSNEYNGLKIWDAYNNASLFVAGTANKQNQFKISSNHFEDVTFTSDEVVIPVVYRQIYEGFPLPNLPNWGESYLIIFNFQFSISKVL